MHDRGKQTGFSGHSTLGNCFMMQWTGVFSRCCINLLVVRAGALCRAFTAVAGSSAFLGCMPPAGAGEGDAQGLGASTFP